MNHELKCWPSFYVSKLDHSMQFEIRKDDRNVQKGDTLTLREFMPGKDFTGRHALFNVTCVLRDFPGLVDGYCAIGIQRIYGPAA